MRTPACVVGVTTPWADIRPVGARTALSKCFDLIEKTPKR